jgi:sarcosine oxidase subunit gamma
MDDLTLTRQAALAAPVTLLPGPSWTRHVLRLPEAAAAAAGAALPPQACRAAVGDGRAALWLGPDEYLLLSPAGAAFDPALAAALADQPHALVDVTHRQLGFTVTGDRAAALLNAECPLDLRLSAFPVGMCTRTLFGRAEILLWRQAETVFYLECWRSFAAYVWELATLIAQEPDL